MMLLNSILLYEETLDASTDNLFVIDSLLALV